MFEIPYGAVERALARTYDVPEPIRGAGFRSALANLQKLGVLGEAARVGRGAPLTYRPDQVHRVVFALELCELGVPPATAVNLIASFWEPKIKAIFKEAERTVAHETDPNNDVVVELGGVRLRTGVWSAPKSMRFPGVPNINWTRAGKLAEHVRQWMTMGPDDPAGLPPRAMITNLSQRLRSFHRALAAVHSTDLRGDAPSARAHERGKVGRKRKSLRERGGA